MERTVIGVKLEMNVALVILMVLGGVALAAGGVLLYVFVIRGAIGGGLAGASIAAGGFLVVYGIKAKTLPLELVHINEIAVYLPKNSVLFEQILSVTAKGTTLTITKTDGKKITQSFLKNAEDCMLQIQNARLQHQQNRQI